MTPLNTTEIIWCQEKAEALSMIYLSSPFTKTLAVAFAQRKISSNAPLTTTHQDPRSMTIEVKLNQITPSLLATSP